MELLIALVVIFTISVFYSYSLSENGLTPVPEGCSDALIECKSCSDISCDHQGH
ncbi:MAG: hypothetical protein GXY98_00690 [Erysipelothrix sp.]|nr:hypothetical protein [Erysipelothrix sp.]